MVDNDTNGSGSNPEVQLEHESLKRAGRLHWYHWLIIVASLVLTLGAWHIAKSQAEDKMHSQFERAAKQAVALVTERVELYENALWSGAATIHSQSHGIDLEEWRRFSHTLKIEERYPGINGIGLIYHVTQDDLAGFIQEQQDERPGFKVYPEHKQSEHFPITYIEPRGENRKAVGLDIAHETNRYEAAKKARDTGLAQITGPIILVQDQEQTPGFLFYAPLYDNQNQENIADRQKSFEGLVYAPFIFKNLMSGTLSKQDRQVDILLRDGDDILYDEAALGAKDHDMNPLLVKEVMVEMYGRNWTFEIASNLSFRHAMENNKPWMILIGGLLINALLLTVFVILARSNKMALAFADRMTKMYKLEAEQLQKTSAALASSNSELEEFAYRTSHDLRSPLVSSIALLSMVKDLIRAKQEDKAVEAVEHVEISLKKLEDLVKDILSLTKVKNKAEDIEEVDVPEAVKGAIEGIANLDNFDRIEFITEFNHKDLPVTQKSRMKLIVENLISNAVKYQDTSKDKSFVKIKTYQEGNDFIFEVEDNGLGVPAEHRDSLFVMFKRFHAKTSFGSGLGLYMVQKSAEMLGGEMLYKPAESGSIFKLRVPISCA